MSLAWFYSLSVFGAGVGREDRGEALPPGAELQEQRPLEQRDSDHEEVSVNYLPVAHEQTSEYMFFLSNRLCMFGSLSVID